MPSTVRVALFGVFVLALTTLMWFAGELAAEVCNLLAANGNPLAMPLFIGSSFVGAVVCFAALWLFARAVAA
jgi:hypothetical protein